MHKLTINCYVQPNAKTTEYAGIFNNCHKFKLNSLPIDGKANDELIKFFAEEFKVSKSKINLIKGKLSRYKTVTVNNPYVIPWWFNA